MGIGQPICKLGEASFGPPYTSVTQAHCLQQSLLSVGEIGPWTTEFRILRDRTEANKVCPSVKVKKEIQNEKKVITLFA